MTRATSDTLARDVYLAVVRLHDRLSAEFAELFRAHGVGPAQYNVLRILAGAPRDGLRCTEIRARLLTRVPDVTRLVDRMVAAELVSRERSETDRRAVRVRLTPAGRAKLRKLARPVEELHRAQLRGLAPTRLERLRRDLEAVLAHLDDPTHA